MLWLATVCQLEETGLAGWHPVGKGQLPTRGFAHTQALEDAFLAIDAKLTTEEVIKELSLMAGRPQDDEDEKEKVADEDDGESDAAAQTRLELQDRDVEQQGRVSLGTRFSVPVPQLILADLSYCPLALSVAGGEPLSICRLNAMDNKPACPHFLQSFLQGLQDMSGILSWTQIWRGNGVQCSAPPGWWQPPGADGTEAERGLFSSSSHKEASVPPASACQPRRVPGVEPCAAPTGYLVTSLETHAR